MPNSSNGIQISLRAEFVLALIRWLRRAMAASSCFTNFVVSVPLPCILATAYFSAVKSRICSKRKSSSASGETGSRSKRLCEMIIPSQSPVTILFKVLSRCAIRFFLSVADSFLAPVTEGKFSLVKTNIRAEGYARKNSCLNCSTIAFGTANNGLLIVPRRFISIAAICIDHVLPAPTQ